MLSFSEPLRDLKNLDVEAPLRLATAIINMDDPRCDRPVRSGIASITF